MVYYIMVFQELLKRARRRSGCTGTDLNSAHLPTTHAQEPTPPPIADASYQREKRTSPL